MKEINISIQKGEIFSEFQNSKNGSCVYGFKLENSDTPMLEVRIYSKIHNAITSEIGASKDLRLGKSLDLILIDGLICGIYIERNIILADYYNGRFDGMELYLKNNYDITCNELIELIKEQTNTRKLKGGY